MDANYSDYFVQRQCALQWQGVLAALSQELSGQLGVAELRDLMRGTGARFASTHPVPACDSVADMQAAMCTIWRQLDWGWVELTEHDAALAIMHHCSPLHSALGEVATPWWPAFLEGVYQEWFAQLGAGELLRVTQSSEADAFGTVSMQLAQP